MYRGRLWTMRQYAGFATAAESNARYRYLLERGQTGLSVAFDLPTQLGYDSDAPQARGEVGKVGVAIDSIADMETLLDGIPLEHVTVSMTINAPASILLALLLAVARRRGIPFSKLGGTIQNDVLKEYVARGTYIYPPKPSMRLVTDVMAYCAREVPQWNTISISGYHIREAGSTAVEEIAFTLCQRQGVPARGARRRHRARRRSRRASPSSGTRTTISSRRSPSFARRAISGRISRATSSAATIPRSQMLRFHTQTGGSTLTAQEPENNVVRVDAAGARGRARRHAIAAHQRQGRSARASDGQESAKLALRTQQIIAYESGVADVVDPLAGSYYVESLTNAADRARARLDRRGRRAGRQRSRRSRAAGCSGVSPIPRTPRSKPIERGETDVVGVNASPRARAEAPIALQRIDERVEREQVERLRAFRAARDAAQVEARLAELRVAAAGKGNLMPLLRRGRRRRCDARRDLQRAARRLRNLSRE